MGCVSRARHTNGMMSNRRAPHTVEAEADERSALDVSTMKVGMLQALGHLIPIAVAVALSSIPIMATILILLSPNKRRTSIPFLVGWVVGIAAVATLFTIIAQALPTPGPKKPQVALGIAEMVIGVAMVVLAVISWRRAGTHPSSGEPKWLSAVGSFGIWTSLGFAFILNLRPKALLLSIAVGLALRGDKLNISETAVVLAIYTIIGASTVALPIIYSLFSPVRATRWLESAHGWIARNNRIVSISIMLMIGVVIFSSGLTRL
jgi:Sap, sulfolipid-1-addressing protein